MVADNPGKPERTIRNQTRRPSVDSLPLPDATVGSAPARLGRTPFYRVAQAAVRSRAGSPAAALEPELAPLPELPPLPDFAPPPESAPPQEPAPPQELEPQTEPAPLTELAKYGELLDEDHPALGVQPDPAPLTIASYVGAYKTTWNKCNKDMKPFTYEGVVYRMGDIVVVKNHWLDENKQPLANHFAIPTAWTAVLCDYSTLNPVADGRACDPVPRPGTEEPDFEWLAVNWIFTQEEIQKFVDGRSDYHENVRVKKKKKFMKTFLHEDLPANQRFLTTEIEWMNIEDLCGHLKPSDIGSGEEQISVNFDGPVVGVAEKWLARTAEEDALHFQLSAKATFGLPKGTLPVGWPTART